MSKGSSLAILGGGLLTSYLPLLAMTFMKIKQATYPFMAENQETCGFAVK
jgi:hypothetical protein